MDMGMGIDREECISSSMGVDDTSTTPLGVVDIEVCRPLGMMEERRGRSAFLGGGGGGGGGKEEEEDNKALRPRGMLVRGDISKREVDTLSSGVLLVVLGLLGLILVGLSTSF